MIVQPRIRMFMFASAIVAVVVFQIRVSTKWQSYYTAEPEPPQHVMEAKEDCKPTQTLRPSAEVEAALSTSRQSVKELEQRLRVAQAALLESVEDGDQREGEAKDEKPNQRDERAAVLAYKAYQYKVTHKDKQKDKNRIPENLHAHYPLECRYNNFTDSSSTTWPVPAATFPWMEMTFNYFKRYNAYWSGHRNYKKDDPQDATDQMSTTHTCRYATLELWWELAAQHNMTRWVAHGGTAMGAYCHHSVNPWDDDIDITLDHCHTIDRLFEHGRSVSDVYPDLPIDQYTSKYHNNSRLISDDLILMKGSRYFKLKMVQECNVLRGFKDLGGIDIQCFDRCIPKNERIALRESNLEAVLKDPDHFTLEVVPFGPTFIQQVPFPILQSYVNHRYQKKTWCDFPYQKAKPKFITRGHQDELLLEAYDNPKASQMHEAVASWYSHPALRYKKWRKQVGTISGQELTQQVLPPERLNHVEIDNSIAPPSACRISSTTTKNLKILNFNAQRGAHWDKFAHMVGAVKELQQPDVILLNEMDIGMARSGNIHTTRKLAYQLGLNYAWAMEFVELTRGNRYEQNQTNGLIDAVGVHGNAILSTCEIYDPKVFRDELKDIYFSEQANWMNADGFEKRLGGRMALFARTGSKNIKEEEDSNTMTTTTPRNHLVVGSVHKLSSRHRPEIYDYFGAGIPPPTMPPTTTTTTTTMNNTSFTQILQMPKHQLGIVFGGEFDRKRCRQYGMDNLDLSPQPLRKTFRSDCTKPTDLAAGNRRSDFFCGSNMEIVEQDITIPPCFGGKGEEGLLQIADHAIMQIVLKPVG